MNRRQFSAYLAVSALASPAVRAQNPGRTYRLGVVFLPPRTSPPMAALIDELRVAGFVEGRNLIVDERGFGGPPARFAPAATELAISNVDLFICASGGAAIRAAQQATTSIPIVALADDMVQEGFVELLANRTGNITGISILGLELDFKTPGVPDGTLAQGQAHGGVR